MTASLKFVTLPPAYRKKEKVDELVGKRLPRLAGLRPANFGHFEEGSFFRFVTYTFGTRLSPEQTLIFSALTLLRKHVLFQFSTTSRYDDRPAPPRIREEDYTVDWSLMLERCTPLAHALSFTDPDHFERDVVEVLDLLKRMKVPDSVVLSPRDLDLLVDRINVSDQDFKSHWLENDENCKAYCPEHVRRNDLLDSSWVDVTVTNKMNREGMGYKEASSAATALSESELLRGMFRLALEVWSLDYDLIGGQESDRELSDRTTLSAAFSESSPPLVGSQLLVDSLDRPVTVMPRRPVPESSFEGISGKANIFMSNSSSSSSFSDSDLSEDNLDREQRDESLSLQKDIGGKPKTQRKSAAWKRKPRERELWKRRLRRAHPESRDLLKRLEYWDHMLQGWTDLLDEEGWDPPRVNTEEHRQRYQIGVNKALRKIREIEDKLKVLEEESEKSLASIGGKRGAEEQEEKRKKRRKGAPEMRSSLFYDPDTQTAHPYVQYKTNLLVKRCGYAPGVANKMMLWNVMPPNFTMPFALLLRILRGFHAALVPGYAISPFGVGAALVAEPSLRSVTTSTTTATQPLPGAGLSTNTTSSSFGSSVLPSDYF